jgi:hypothetical protein
MEMRRTGFLVEPQNQGRRFVSGLAPKPLGWFSLVWPQNHSDGFHWFGLKTDATVSSGLASKPAATVFSNLSSKLVAMVSPSLASKSAVGFLVEPQNQGGGGFSGLGVKIGSSGLVIWASKLPRWFLGVTLTFCESKFCRCSSALGCISK